MLFWICLASREELLKQWISMLCSTQPCTHHSYHAFMTIPTLYALCLGSTPLIFVLIEACSHNYLTVIAQPHLVVLLFLLPFLPLLLAGP